MSATQQNHNAVENPFSLTVDQYGRLWLHTKAQGVPIMLDLAEKGVAFEIMASTMAENGFEFHPIPDREAADNDDQK